jgi:hypothetical protein
VEKDGYFQKGKVSLSKSNFTQTSRKSVIPTNNISTDVKVSIANANNNGVLAWLAQIKGKNGIHSNFLDVISRGQLTVGLTILFFLTIGQITSCFNPC